MTERVGVGVEFVGSSVGAVTAAKQTATSIETVKVAGAQAAKDAVAQGVQKRAALRENIAAYREEAASAVRGSDEQIVALAKLGEAQRAFAALSVKSAATVRDSRLKMSESGFARGATSKLSGLGGWMAGPGFIAGAGVGIVVDRAIKAYAAETTALGQRNQALKNAHASVSALLPILQRYEELGRKAGWTDEQTMQAETELVRAFGATKKSLGELNVAENLARSKREDLGTATKDLILLQEGNTRAAKQFGLALPDLTAKQWAQKAAQDGLTTSQEKGKVLYDELLPRIKDANKAFADSPAGKMAEFDAELNKIETDIGQGLLPVVVEYLSKVDEWLSKSGNQKRVTHDVEVVVHDLEAALKDAYTATKAVLDIAEPIVHQLGGWKTVIETLIGLKFASTILGWVSALEKLIGAKAAGGVLGAESASAGLLSKLGALKALGAIGVTIAVSYEVAKGAQQFGNWLDGTWFGKNIMGAGVPLPPGVSFGDISRAQQDYNSGHLTARDKKVIRAIAKAAGQPDPFGVTGPAGPAGPIGRGDGKGAKGAGVAVGASTNDAIVRAGKALHGTGRPEGTYVSGGGHQAGEVKVGSALDCSGFVYQSLLRAGVKGFSYSNAYDQFNQLSRGVGGNWSATNVGVGGAKPGDIVYWDNGERGNQPQHCGIVVSGSGANAMCMQYEDPKDGSGLGGINEYPPMGVFRVTIVKGRPTGGTGSPYGPSTAGAVGGGHGKSNVSAVTGSNLIPIGLRGAIGHAANMATTTHGLVAARWLHTEITDLEHARTLLEGKLKSASGKQRTAIQAEIQSIDSAIARTQKSFAGALAGWAKTQLARIEKQADAAFQKQTAQHIQDVLAPKFFQGTDAKGNQRLTPAEAALAKMQAQDVTDQLQQQLAQAQASGDQTAIAAAQRAIAENDLATKATEERAKADADYAKAVKKYQAERDKIEAKLNARLSAFVDEVARGTKALADLRKVLEGFGLPGGAASPSAAQGGGQPRHRGGGSGSSSDPNGDGIIHRGPWLHLAAGGTVGKVPGPTYVNQDIVPALLTPGETVIDKRLTAALEQSVLRGRTGPPWHSEGPRFYHDAFAFFSKYAADGPYQTMLSKANEAAFERWVDKKRVPFDYRAKIADYDMRGFWLHGGKWGGGNQHFPDTWKTPYDTTFSRESRYATANNPFDWVGENLRNLKTGRLIFSPHKMSDGGKVPGPTYVNRDTVPILATPGETVIDKRLTSALEQLVFHGGGPVGGGMVGDVYMDSYKVGRTVARPVTDAQRRQIAYTLQRG